MLREIDELALLYDIPENDDQLALVRLLAKEAEGNATAVAKLQRSSANRARHLLGLVDRNGNLRHEIRRLEEVLAWIHRTEQPLDAIRGVIEKTVPRAVRREHDDRPRPSVEQAVEIVRSVLDYEAQSGRLDDETVEALEVLMEARSVER